MIGELVQRWIRGMAGARQTRRRGNDTARRPLLEQMESRMLLSTYTVTSLADPTVLTNNTLRWAVQQADAAAGASTIAFQAGLSGTINLTQGPLNLTGPNTTITGPGAGTLLLSGAGLNEVFLLTTGSTAAISGVTIENGSAAQGGGISSTGILTLTACTFSNNAANNGGAIANQGTVTITSCTFTGNSALVNGGAINSSGALNIASSTFTNNSCLTSGGAIYCGGTAAVAGSTFTTNTAASNTALNQGGGIFNKGSLTLSASTFTGNAADEGGGICNNGLNSANLLTVTTSTFSANTATINGGGVSNVLGTINISGSTFSANTVTFTGALFAQDDGAGGGLDNEGAGVITNCTFANNIAPDFGGGFDNENSVGTTLTVNDCTISGNTAPSGAGIYLVNTATLNNTIVAGNTGGDVAGLNGTTLAAAGSFNLIGDGSGGLVNGTGGASGNLQGTVGTPLDAKLGALAANGGPTKTMALLTGSPAIDAGSNSLVPAGVTTDQRGTGFARIVDGTVDIGAYESPQVATKLVFGTVPGGAVVGSAIAPDVTVNVEDYKNTVVTADASTVTLSVGSGPGTLAGTVSAVQSTVWRPSATWCCRRRERTRCTRLTGC
jgi:predicted outer membrane repeat protein